MKHYVAGFFFDYDSGQVILLRKAKPDWQAGLYNAVGGKIEPGETPVQAMQREFKEEAGIDVAEHRWECFAKLVSPNWECHFFRAWADDWKEFDSCSTQDPDEPIVQFITRRVKLIGRDIAISNIPWLLGLALNTNAGLKLPTTIEYKG